MTIRQNEGFSYVGRDFKRAVSLDLPAFIRRSVHLPKDDAVVVSLVSNSLAPVDFVLNFGT